MSAWAEMPWVLAVGATGDPAGTTLANYSARGITGIADSGPDVVAYGASVFDPNKLGTSFAAPRVSGGAVLCAAIIEQLRFQIERQRGAQVHGIPLVGWALVDEFGDDPLPMPPRLAVPALPPIGVDEEALASSLKLLDAEQIELDLTVTPNRLRWMLVSSAQPMPRFGQHEVGAGFYSEEGLHDWFAGFSGAHLGWLAAPAVPGSETLRALSEFRLLVPDELTRLHQVIRDTAPVWRFDVRTGALQMRPEEMPVPAEALTDRT
jgi:hypothetical protein